MTSPDELQLGRVVRELREMGVHVTPDGRVTAAGAATLIGLSQKTLRNWRAAGDGPPWVQAGQVWYRVGAVLDWLHDQHRESMP